MIRFYSDKYPDLVPYSVPAQLKYWELFERDNMKVYSQIFINFNAEPGEQTSCAMLVNKQVIVSASFDVPEDYIEFDDVDKQALILEMIDDALHKLAVARGKLSVEWLDKIKAEILPYQFDFWIPVKRLQQKSGSKEWMASLVLHPKPGSYEVYLDIIRNNIPITRHLLYETIPDRKIAISLFGEGKWSADGILSLQSSIAEIKVRYDAVNDGLDFSLNSQTAANFWAYGAGRTSNYPDKAVFLERLPVGLRELLR
ncbi:hypothetical protein [Chitinophaga caseinilytica]|uniref:hypothetical protein n=1 Tax=Chitinophaga caseinilytica TaxID=2267521 RepID=UPI003C2AB99E